MCRLVLAINFKAAVFKKTIRKIHLWLGLITGLLVFIIAITGSIYTFQEELQNLTQPYRFIPNKSAQVLLPDSVIKIAKNVLPDKTLHSVKYFNDNHSIEGIFYHRNPDYYYRIYVHPNSGKVLHIQNLDEGFFPFILKGHMYLWLPENIGRIVVLVTTLIFFLMVILGLILWWPKDFKIAKTRMWFKWTNASTFKRKNWDLHAIIGFYACVFALLFIITGLVWVMPKFAEVYHSLLGGEKSMVYSEPKSILEKTELSPNILNNIFLHYQKQAHTFYNIELHPAETDSSSILVVTNPSSETYWKSNYTFHNQYTAAVIPVKHIWGSFKDAHMADKILRMNYDIHVGALLGFTGKVIVCVTSLLIASLPVTGLFIWLGRRSKPKNK